MSIRRVRVTYSGLSTVGGGLSTFMFDTGTGTATQCVTAVAAFMGAVDNQMSNTVVWQTESDVATLDTQSGQLESITSTTPQTGQGALAGEILPPATQGLLRLRTDVIVGGRLLRGRLFLPGMTETNNDGGGPLAALRTAIDAAAATLIADANSNWQVWGKTSGSQGAITSATLWTKWGILRSRRD